MYEPEEPDDSTSPAMRRVFDELERSSTPGCAGRRTGGVAAVRAELGSTVLWEQLLAASAARRPCSPAAAPSAAPPSHYPEFLVLRAVDGAEHLIRYGPEISVAVPAEPPTLRPTPTAATRRYQFALALRELARRREPVRVELVDGTRCDGTIEAVGSDYLEVAEHDLGEARRRAAVRARRFLGFAAVVAVTLPPACR